jgi:hypothetical protein
MNSPVTIGGLLAVLGLIIGIAVTGAGIVTFLAGGMSDAPAEGDSAGTLGCSLAAAGAIIIAICIWILA